MAFKREGDPVARTKKSRRVGFAAIDPGVSANECMDVYMVRSPDEIDAKTSVPVDIVDIGHFFGEDDKIYGYKDLKINVWMSCISLHAYADIKFQASFDGGKGITQLKSALEKIFGESLVDKEEFLQKFNSETHYIRNAVSSGTVIHSSARADACGSAANAPINADSTIEVVRMGMDNMEVGLLYSRLVPFVLLLVDGSRPIDITDPRWELYLIVENIQSQSGDACVFLGFSTVYSFFHYPDSTRLRISQILVLPPYRGHGHGRCLLESINSVAISENAYDVTAEEPSEYLQDIRACIDTSRLLNFEPVRPPLSTILSLLQERNFYQGKKFPFYPSVDVVESARKKLKINKKQFFRCWDVLVFLELDQRNSKLTDAYKACISDSLKYDILDKNAGSNGKHMVELPNEHGDGTTFVVFRSKVKSTKQACQDLNGLVEEGDKAELEEQLNMLVQERMEEIANVAHKVVQHAKKGTHLDK